MNGSDIMNFPRRSAALLLALAALSGCKAFDKEEPAYCPRVSVLADTANLVQFRPGSGRDVSDEQLRAEFASYHGTCRYDKPNKTMTISMNVGIDAERRPGAQGRAADLAYFVAIPAFYPKPEAKVVMPVALQFPDNSNYVHYVDEEVRISIPIEDLKQLKKYEVFVGLQLTPEQLDYNRQKHASR